MKDYQPYKTRNNILALIILLLLFSRCTENPFDDENNTQIKDRHILQGTISLSDTTSKNNIFIWLAGAGISTTSDNSGSFILRLPNTPELKGLNGLFGLYYYLGNYRLDSTQVFIREGLFDYGGINISSEGTILDSPTLQKLLDIQSTYVRMNTDSSNSFLLSITIELWAYSKPVYVKTLKDREQFLTSIIFLKKNSPLLESKLFKQPYGSSTVEVIPGWGKSIWYGLFSIPANYLEPGEYEIVPYIQIIQENIPEELLLSFGEEVEELSLDYLKVPFKRSTAVLQIPSN